MNHFRNAIDRLLVPVFVLAILASPAGHTWQEPAETGAAPASADDSAEEPGTSREVDVSEDNYRRFMELKDQRQQSASLPAMAYSRPASLEKMENLPEASQRHLRNQLTTIISDGDAWQPGDEQGQYPYVPSQAAQTDAALRGQEAEAWKDLVAQYHEREAAIFANAKRTQAATMPAGAGGLGNEGEAQDAEPGIVPLGAGARLGQQGQNHPPAAAQGNGSATASATDTPATDGSESTRGTAQNALQMLSQAGNAPAGQSTAGDGASQPGTEGSTAEQQANQGSNDNDAAARMADNEAATASPSQAASASNESRDKAEARATDQSAAKSTEPDTEQQQKARNMEVIYRSKGTLSVEELAAAKGLSDTDSEAETRDDRGDE